MPCGSTHRVVEYMPVVGFMLVVEYMPVVEFMPVVEYMPGGGNHRGEEFVQWGAYPV